MGQPLAEVRKSREVEYRPEYHNELDVMWLFCSPWVFVVKFMPPEYIAHCPAECEEAMAMTTVIVDVCRT